MTGGANGDLSPSSAKTRGNNAQRDSSGKVRKARKQKKTENELTKAENFSRLNRFEKIKVRY